MSSDTDTKPNKIFGYEKQVHTGRNPIENVVENIKGVIFGPLIWIRGTYLICILNLILFYRFIHYLYK